MNYYNYTFVSPEPFYAQVKEELKSYFDTGAVDDLLFPRWTEQCLKRLGKGSFPIQPTLLFIQDFEAKLPPDFHSVREAWGCTISQGATWRLPGAYYRKITTRASDDYTPIDNCGPCNPCPVLIDVVYKTTTDAIIPGIRTTHLLEPGNISAQQSCAGDCFNIGVSSPDKFDIRGQKFVTSFREGDVYMAYYSLETDEEGNQLIPDNFRYQEYIMKYLKYKIFEQLWNQVTDETFNQIERKYIESKQQSDEALAEAQIETKKQTVNQKKDAIIRQKNRLRKYNIK